MLREHMPLGGQTLKVPVLHRRLHRALETSITSQELVMDHKDLSGLDTSLSQPRSLIMIKQLSIPMVKITEVHQEVVQLAQLHTAHMPLRASLQLTEAKLQPAL